MAGPDQTTANEFRQIPARAQTKALAAVGMLIVCLLLLSWIATRDLQWKRKHDAAMEHGTWAANADDFQAARDYYLQALIFNPYSPEAHYRIAEIYGSFFGENEEALKHYAAALDFAPKQQRAVEAANAIAVLEMIMAGILEDPVDAVEDMYIAASQQSLASFSNRLDPTLPGNAGAYMKAWSERGKGVLRHRRIRQRSDDEFDAVLSFSYANGDRMSMHFTCQPGQPWKLDASFP